MVRTNQTVAVCCRVGGAVSAMALDSADEAGKNRVMEADDLSREPAVVLLDDVGLLRFQGPDVIGFLQGYLTSDALELGTIRSSRRSAISVAARSARDTRGWTDRRSSLRCTVLCATPCRASCGPISCFRKRCCRMRRPPLSSWVSWATWGRRSPACCRRTDSMNDVDCC